MNDKIFISHSSKDIDFVKEFVESILQLGLGISHERIFCSSMEGHGVQSGEYIPDRLKEEMRKSCLAILFISDNYRTSEVCLNEVGAAWVTLERTNVIPLLLPEVGFDRLGFLDISRIALKIDKSEDLYKLVQDNRQELNPDFNLELVNQHIKRFLAAVQDFEPKPGKSNGESSATLEKSEWSDCFDQHLFPYNEILRKSIPTLLPGIHEITDQKQRRDVLINLSKAEFLNQLWYQHSGGDFYVNSLPKLPTGNWLIGGIWELKIEDIWIGLGHEPQNDFILIKSVGLPPFIYQSDVGGEGYTAGILSDGTIVSENEDSNGYAVIGQETINLHENGVRTRYRDQKTRWVFLVTDYHKIGFNPDETENFCKHLDNGDLELNAQTLKKHQRSLRNHPTVLMHR
jgi:hypothetical protein